MQVQTMESHKIINEFINIDNVNRIEICEDLLKILSKGYLPFFVPLGFNFSEISHNASSLRKSAKLLKQDNILSFFLNS